MGGQLHEFCCQLNKFSMKNYVSFQALVSHWQYVIHFVGSFRSPGALYCLIKVTLNLSLVLNK